MSPSKKPGSPCPIVEPLADLGQLRRLMPVVGNGLYLDHAADGPLPQPTVDAIQARVHSAATAGVLHWNDWQKCVQRTRHLAGQLVNVASDEIAFAPNTAAGIATVAAGYPWISGDNMVLPKTEFPSNRIPWLNLRRRGVDVRLVDTPDDADSFVAAINHACDTRTRVVAASWVDYLTGVRRDAGRLAEVAHRNGALLVLDAIQGLGVLDIDMQAAEVDVLVADSRKWLLGPDGVAILAVRRDIQERLEPVFSGWVSLKDPMDFTREDPQFSGTATRFESGMHNTYGIAGLHASLTLLKEIALSVREQLLLAVRSGFQDAGRRAGLQSVDLPLESQSGIISFEHPQLSAASIVKNLRRNGTVVNLRNDRIRVSPHLYNTQEDADRFRAALSQLPSPGSRGD